MIVKLLTEHHLAAEAHPSLSNCWKSHATAQHKLSKLYLFDFQDHTVAYTSQEM